MTESYEGFLHGYLLQKDDLIYSAFLCVHYIKL